MSTTTLGAGITGKQLTNLAAPLLIVMILGMMVLPLPALLLDLLFTFNIALAMMVLLAAMQTTKPLEFSAFPTVLLLTTLMRLSLNVASTRVVLLNGHTGPDAAGKVIEAFGHFLVGGNYAVGIVVFIILVVINFVVITKGAGRIAEVTARFTLDAMPGKQMAIDADLNAGLINETEARRRRKEVGQEAEFYGSMDGASKFVRGDAIAGILILFINIIGGLIIGIAQHDLSFAQAANNYVLLAIGDGLVAQVPALVISMAAGLIVSRVGDEKNIGEQMIEQLFARSQALMISGAVLGVLGLMPGMLHLVFIGFGLLCVLGGFWIRRNAKTIAAPEASPVAVVPDASQEASWDDLVPVDVLALEVGYRLIPLVDRKRRRQIVLEHADGESANNVHQENEDSVNGIAAHEFAGAVHGAVELGLLRNLDAALARLGLADQPRVEVRVDRHLFAGHRIKGEARTDLRDTACALGNHHEIDDHQDHEHHQSDGEIAAHQHLPE